MTKTLETRFANLHWDDLEQWVGATILKRGKSYQHHVQDLAITADNHLIAIVSGTQEYITRVWLKDGKPDCHCSCPYWAACKHGVAVVLAYLDSIQSNTPVCLLQPEELEARLSVYGMTDDEGNEPYMDIKQARTVLKKLSKAQLIEWAMEIFADDSSLFDTLPTVRQSAEVPLDKTIARLRQQIRKTTSERGWHDHWNNNGYIPDYSVIQKQLTKLLRSGHIDAVLELGEELFVLGSSQVSESDDEWETADELISCLDIVFIAMGKSQKPVAERMIWFWDKLLHDDFALLDNIEPPINDIAMTKADWLQVAEEFTQRLANCDKPKKTNDRSSDKYHRQKILRYASKALAQAGECERVIQLMTDELPYSDNYVELVDYLLANKAYEQAEHWALQGFDKTIDSSPGLAWNLVDRLLDIARERKNWSQVAAFQVVIFLEKTSVENYQLVQKHSNKAGCWTQVRAGLIGFLETGVSPMSATDWPLPDTALTIPKSKYRMEPPDYHELIDIALYEKRTEDALRWFRQAPNKIFHAEAIAQAVKKTHPDISLKIWQGKVAGLIALVKPKAYREAIPCLKKIQSLMQSLERSDDYRGYIASLRHQHKAKRRLIEELDALENKGKKSRRILDD